MGRLSRDRGLRRSSEAADAGEGHQTGAAIGRNVGRGVEAAPITGGDGNIRDEMLANDLGDLSLIGVAQRRLRSPGNDRRISDQLKMRKWHDEFARRRQVFVFPRLEFFDKVPR